ncbi:ATP-binding protein [Microlunatus parietis]|nr:ATP-binding protein [Microlunatus parietis]
MMSSGLFSAIELDGGHRAGYRLQRIELFNWGTFDGRVWRLTPDGETSLLTGDIGSGKSTLVDAITTLLLPAHRIAYNKAAGAESRERTLRSYVEGHYKSERIERTGTSKAVGLRDHTSYSVILGVFGNEGHDETVTLAQVFHQKDRAGQPDRFFVTSGKPLSIEADFTDFGADLGELRRRLRNSGAVISNVYPEYARQLRRALGIKSDQALDLFHQTVSMKSVGNLNDFVRNHMLEPADAAERVDAIIAHFEDLTKAHEAVRRAREQLAALEPLVATADRYDDALARRTGLERQRDAVRLYFAELRIALLSGEIEAYETEQHGHRTVRDEAEQDQGRLRERGDVLITQRAAAGGDRIGQLERDEATAREQCDGRRRRFQLFSDQLAAAGLESVADVAGFRSLIGSLGARRAGLRERRAALNPRLAEHAARRAELRRQQEETKLELSSLAGRASNLPSQLLDLREQLCRELDLDVEALPFAGELIDVAEGYETWRGAAERVLRGFAQSLLVRQDDYPAVADWVNGRRLTYRRWDGEQRGLRLVYERVPLRQVALQPPVHGEGLLLAQTLEIAPGPFESYLGDQLHRRADHRCTETLAEFRQAHRAVTPEGQVRSGDHHEKDDRSRVDDPRTWVLGWANARKIEALTAHLEDVQRELEQADQALAKIDRERDELDAEVSALDKLETVTDWRELDWREAEGRAENARQERERLLAGAPELAEIDRQLKINKDALSEVEGRIAGLSARISVLDDRIGRADQARRQELGFVHDHSEVDLVAARSRYDELNDRLGADRPTEADACQGVAAELTQRLQRELDRLGKEIGGYVTSLVGAMNEVRRRWPEATTEMDAAIEARDEFRTFRDRVASDDLPAFEDEFKRQLNTNTIRELAGFNSWLRRQSDDIGSRIDTINEALGAIDYAPGRYIRLEMERTVNTEVQAFRSELRAATDDALVPVDDHYSEQRFLDVQRIIERFRGRPNHTDTDKAWTRRVTDVRNWFTFSASERDRESDVEWEHYRDSDGKSGGQKEKLAYTILAASLAYQFGLEWGVEKSKDFRFAVIDEAFGRGSDLSTRYALELFAKLGLQLLIVTPLQKVHIIEPYVRSIGFVDNPTGSYSRLQTLTIEEFRAQRDGRAPRE